MHAHAHTYTCLHLYAHACIRTCRQIHKTVYVYRKGRPSVSMRPFMSMHAHKYTHIKHIYMQKAAAGSLDVIIDTCPINSDIEPFMNLLKFDGVYCRVGIPKVHIVVNTYRETWFVSWFHGP